MFGGASIDAHGIALTDETLAACRAADAVLLAAVGGPKWDTTDPAKPRPEQGLLGVRKGLGLFANLRPVQPIPALYDASPLKREVDRRHRPARRARADRRDLLRREDADRGQRLATLCVYTRAEIERIARVAFGAARPRVTSVDKANVLETSRLWREVVRDVHADGVPGRRARAPARRQRGDAAGRSAAPLRRDRHREHVRRHPRPTRRRCSPARSGCCPSASLGDGGPGLFEPVHGSAPDIAGQGIANPLAMFLSAALMLRHGFGMEAEAAAVESAVDRALAEGLRTPDLGGEATTAQATRQPCISDL